MGDGRYYSVSQFYSIVFLTILLIFFAISVTFYSYRGDLSMRKKRFLTSYLGLIISALFCFYEWLTPNPVHAYYSILFSTVFFAGFLLAFDNMLYVETNFYLSKNPISKHKAHMCAIVGIFVSYFMTVCFYPQFILMYDAFNSSRFTRVFALMIAFISLLIIINSTNLLIRIKLRKKQLNGGEIFLAVLLLVVVPTLYLAGYIYFLKVLSRNLYYITHLLAGLSLIGFYGRVANYRVSASVFNDVKALILDHVFIIDTRGQIIYKNKGALQSSLFVTDKMIDTKSIESFFSYHIDRRFDYDKEILIIKNKKIYYFTYTKKVIYQKHMVKGHIITFVDVSDLVIMLDKLKKKSEQAVKVNAKLAQYTHMVYDIEKEREVGILLDEIAETQEKSMSQLKNQIESLITNDKVISTLTIDDLIASGKKNLAKVRSAVSTYMNYYGEKDYD